MRREILMGLASALFALPGRVEAQREEPSTVTRSDLVQYDITCDLKIFSKGGKQFVDNASSVWSALTPPGIFTTLTLRNSGRLGVSVQSTVLLQTDKTGSTPPIGPAYFVNESGVNVAQVVTPVVTVPANGMAVLGPYWLKNEPNTIRYFVTANADSNQRIKETNETNNSCSRTFTIIAPPR
jgi:hypothetical protein